MSTTALNSKQFESKKAVSSIGMIVLLTSFAMLFATLLLGYLIFRLTSEVWPPMGIDPISLTIPSLSTLIIALSSMTYVKFQNIYASKNLKGLKIFYGLTLAAGILFLIAQLALWQSMQSHGLYVSGGIFQSLFYSLTWIHAAHIVAALLSLLILIPTVFGNYNEDKEIWIQNIGKFWHFLGIVWLIMYVIMFVY